MEYLFQDPQEMTPIYAGLGVLIGILLIVLSRLAKRLIKPHKEEKPRRYILGFRRKDEE